MDIDWDIDRDTDWEIAEVDPHDPANEQLLRAMWEVSAAARADRRFALYAPWPTAYVSWTSHRDDYGNVMYAARLGDTVIGMGGLGLPLLDNQHLATAELFVHPDHRRRGVGTALLHALAARARSEGRTVLTAAPHAPIGSDSPGLLMLASRGFEIGIEEMSKYVDLEATEGSWPALVAETAPHHEGYRLVGWQDRVPDDLVEGYCRLAEAFVGEAPTGDLDLEDEVWTAERVRSRDDHFVQTGRHQFGALAYAADGTCVATTELFVNEAASWRGLQGGTLVLPEHRGHRLGLAVKLLNQQAVRERFPDCRYLFTSNAGVNAPMNAVNELLGFADLDREIEMQLRL